jgi:hypothetical protein
MDEINAIFIQKFVFLENRSDKKPPIIPIVSEIKKNMPMSIAKYFLLFD